MAKKKKNPVWDAQLGIRRETGARDMDGEMEISGRIAEPPVGLYVGAARNGLPGLVGNDEEHGSGEDKRDNAVYWYDRGKAYFGDKKYKEALKCLSAFKDHGHTLFELAVEKRDETSVKGARPLFEETDAWFQGADAWFKGCGEWIESVKNDCTKDISEKIRTEFADAYDIWGFTLSYLARTAWREEDKEKALDLFGRAVEKFDAAVSLGWNCQYNALGGRGAMYYRMFLISGEKDYEKKAKEDFKRTKAEILGILVTLDDDAGRPMAESDFLYEMLDDLDSDDGRFFKEITKNADKNRLDEYKKAYILSIYIISKLYVDNEFEDVVACYRGKGSTQSMLFEGAKFRLGAIDYSNDELEGKVLLDYFFGEQTTRERYVGKYRAFAGCFSFNCDKKNQFRLYGGVTGPETGLALVFRKTFFSEQVKLAVKQDEKEGGERKLTLFRCIYFDAAKKCVQTIGHDVKKLSADMASESDKDTEKGKYKDVMNRTIANVDEKIKKLKEIVQDLDPMIAGELLVNLRYLVKGAGFVDEHECRIVKICNLFDGKEKIKYEKDYRMYIEYEPEVSKHVEMIYFGNKATGQERFKDFLEHKGLEVPCAKSSDV